jgi:micrococcal nuclease
MGNCACFSAEQSQTKQPQLEQPQIIPVIHENNTCIVHMPVVELHKEEEKEEKEEKEEEEEEEQEDEAPCVKGFVNDEDKESVKPSKKASKKNPTVFNFLNDSKEEPVEKPVKEVELVKRESIEDVYKNSTNDNTPTYSYEGIKKKVKVLRVVDGDTLDIALHHDETNKIFKYRVRLFGIDTPEKRPLKSDPNRDKEIEASKKSSKAMQDKLEENDNIVVALFYKPDKYGRLLCSIYDKNGNDINEWMIQSGHAYAYYGKTKKSFEEVSKDREE